MTTLPKILITALLGATCAAVAAQSVLRFARAEHGSRAGSDSRRKVDAAALPPGITILRDLRYGDGADETYDVYAPALAHEAPVIFMVHGGGWRRGDKDARGVVQNKVAHWVPAGVIVVSVNYPMLPKTSPLQQAQEVAKALAAAQRAAAGWGGDAGKFVLMGHSAGAHLVSLLSVEPSIAKAQGAQPWLGTVALDSAAFNVVTIMQGPHLGLYDQAFGSDRATWISASPILQLSGKTMPLLAVCSSQRVESCAQAKAFAAKARGFGSRVQVLPEDLRHGQINAELGAPSAYTMAVDEFVSSLSPALAARLR